MNTAAPFTFTSTIRTWFKDGKRRIVATEVGVDYCTRHHGIRNEDMDVCDFKDDSRLICKLTPLYRHEEIL